MGREHCQGCGLRHPEGSVASTEVEAVEILCLDPVAKFAGGLLEVAGAELGRQASEVGTLPRTDWAAAAEVAVLPMSQIPREKVDLRENSEEM